MRPLPFPLASQALTPFSALAFEKLHGAGNDFLFLRLDLEMHGALLRSSGLAAWTRSWCARQCGIGADGVILWSATRSTESSPPQIHMSIVNSDGSRAGTCGNALRCLGLALLRHGLWDGLVGIEVFSVEPVEVPFASLARAKRLSGSGGAQAEAKVGMGRVRYLQPLSPAEQIAVERLLAPWAIQLEAAFAVLLSNPHLVLLAKPQGRWPSTPEKRTALGEELQSWAKRSLPAFEGEAPNVGMAAPVEGSLVVYERGAGLTQCCGSGAVAAGLALSHAKGTSAAVPIVWKMPGGSVQVSEDESGATWLEGPAAWVARVSEAD